MTKYWINPVLPKVIKLMEMPMIHFRVRYRTTLEGPHVYCRLFIAENRGTFASAGNLTMRRNEFEAFRRMFKDAEFVLDD